MHNSPSANSLNTRVSKVKVIFRLVIAGLNVLTLACGVFYMIHPTPYMLWNLFGYAVLLALLGNAAFAYVGGKHRYLDYCYLLLHIVSMFIIPVLNTLASSDVQIKTSQSIFVLILNNVIFLFGAVVAGLRVWYDFQKSTPSTEAGDITQAKAGKIRNVMRWIALTLLWLCILFGIYLSYIMMVKSTSNMIEVFISEYAVFIGLFILGVSILSVKLLWRTKKLTLKYLILTAGIILCVICLIPLAAVPYMVNNADIAYREAFGDAHSDSEGIDTPRGFKQHPFSLQDCFYGTRTSNYVAEENILFYEGTDGADAGIKLHFDVYMPLPLVDPQGSDRNPVLIRIHGGAWTMGDKGFSNYSGINKHFVNLGYVVFDIQYGLNDRNPSFASAAAPDNVKGDFDIDDMVRHIGIFTSYLSEHADEYGADLNSVFISGASAGGQLAIASALGITSGRYTDILDYRLNIKGIIPFYPANGLSPNVGIGGTPDLVDPISLIDEKSPPCLIYHGTHDGIVKPKVADILRETYEDKGDAPCALLWMEFAGHGSDFYTPGYYNQVFMYYMERFMGLYS